MDTQTEDNNDTKENNTDEEHLLIQLDDDNAVDMPVTANEQNDNNLGNISYYFS